MRVLVLCTGNSARSQMAEALLRDLGGGLIDVHSAGTRPAADVHPLAKRVLREDFGLDPGGARPKHVREVEHLAFDYVITVCDHAAETCPVFPGSVERVHWSFPDPAAASADEAHQMFRRVAKDIDDHLRRWLQRDSVRVRVAAG